MLNFFGAYPLQTEEKDATPATTGAQLRNGDKRALCPFYFYLPNWAPAFAGVDLV